ncbi:MAG: hypothetical protein ACI9UU_003424 [Candidatus Azotimanducaceae bacterium]|jgi:hypothetical protein
MPFPTQPEALSAAWLTEALGFNVANFRVELFGEGAGIIGQVTRVHLEGERGNTTIIAKFASPSPDNRAVAATYGMYEREVAFYQNIASDIDIRVPECYFSEMDVANQTFIILMEDIQDMQIGDQVKGCSQTEAEVVVKSLARFHASTWNSDLDLISHNNPAQRAGMMAGFGVGWPVVNEQFAEFIPENGDQLGQTIPAAVPSLLEEMCQAPICISHADVRLDNIFFSDGEIVLVDWQSVCTSAPEQDLAYFVTQSMPADIRRNTDWVKLYHQELVAQGIEDYSLAQCQRRFKVSALYLACYATIISGTLDLANERGQQLGRTLFGNAMTALTDLDAFSLLDA